MTPSPLHSRFSSLSFAVGEVWQRHFQTPDNAVYRPWRCSWSFGRKENSELESLRSVGSMRPFNTSCSLHKTFNHLTFVSIRLSNSQRFASRLMNINRLNSPRVIENEGSP